MVHKQKQSSYICWTEADAGLTLDPDDREVTSDDCRLVFPEGGALISSEDNALSLRIRKCLDR